MRQSYRKTDNIVTRCIGGQTILVPVTSNVAELDSIFLLNEIGTSIWSLMDRHSTLDELVEAITRVYDVEPQEAAESVLEFIDSLREARLVTSEARVEDAAAEL